METVKRELGWAAGEPPSGSHGLPRQSWASLGTRSSCPSHQTVPSGRSATLVKIVSFLTILMAVGLVLEPVPGATPKTPASGLIAQSLPSSPAAPASPDWSCHRRWGTRHKCSEFHRRGFRRRLSAYARRASLLCDRAC